MHISNHAIERYRERVADLPDRAIIANLDTPAIRVAASLGAECHVRLASGQRIVVKDCTVISVLPAENYKRQVRRKGLGRFHQSHRAHHND